MLSLSPTRLTFAGLGLLALLVPLGLGCAHAGETSSAAPSGSSPPWTPSAEEDAVYRALSSRDGAPDCASVEALAKDPTAVLVSVVEHAQQPPWVGVRAAKCLIERHSAEVQPQLVAWVQAPNKRGLAVLLANEMDNMPEPVAVEVAKAGLAGPYAADMRARLGSCKHPAVLALLPSP